MIADPWILLTAAALATSRIRLGTSITPVARRRPSKLAREVTTLDRLTDGRVTLGVGLGAPLDDEYGSFGDTTDAKVLAERLDEGLHALDLLWSGERSATTATRSPSTTSPSCRPRCSAPGSRSGSAASGPTRPRCAARPAGTARCPPWRGPTWPAPRPSPR
ncbi:LLM class flavin-dependent oxidoreductase [Spongiactinospora gelatinilytica]|uniref:LLM class flavin-dependent oxidoreductase n=1 Tax=Spongiactinospora gelatinilytica TaxID=2666298 RepID=UPI0034D1D856